MKRPDPGNLILALIAAALFAEYRSGYAIAGYIAACALLSLISAALLPDYTNKDISREYDGAGATSPAVRS